MCVLCFELIHFDIISIIYITRCISKIAHDYDMQDCPFKEVYIKLTSNEVV